MTLTPSILPFIKSLPDHVQGAWAIAYLEAREREVPPEEAVEEANVAMNLALNGFEMDKEQAKKIDTEQWVQACVGRVWDCYKGEASRIYADSSEFAPAVNLNDELTTIRQNIIRQSLAKWRASKQRQGRTPEECLKDQIRGAFYVARQQADKPPRLDPEGVLAFNKHTKAYALAWWAHLTFEEEA